MQSLPRTAWRTLYRAPQADLLPALLEQADFPAPITQRIRAQAHALVQAARAAPRGPLDISTFLQQYGLGEPEGLALLCVAEALLRIPDAATANALIEDRIGAAQWARHLGKSESRWMNASTWGLILSGQILSPHDASRLPSLVRPLVRRMGEPIIRSALRQGMKILARQFVMGRTIKEALQQAARHPHTRWRYSFDMLGEAARTISAADTYMHAYRDAIAQVGQVGGGPVIGPGVSVKLSALHPRYEETHRHACLPALIERTTELAVQARALNIGLTIDAEEADRLEISLDVLETVLADPRLHGWDGLGLAVQAYQKRARPLIDWLADLGCRTGHRIPTRLVKGAYWDSEIKFAQSHGHADYPVFTRKSATDVSWLACARRMLERSDGLRPAFATHNAWSLATIQTLAAQHNTGLPASFEMQRLYGMGESLYEGVVSPECPVRIYAPVGSHEDLLAYLVRRLLENGANTSFVHALADPAIEAEKLAANPVDKLRPVLANPCAHVPKPADLYTDRRNSAGIDLADRATTPDTLAAIQAAAPTQGPAPAGAHGVYAPHDQRQWVGWTQETTQDQYEEALNTLGAHWREWDKAGGEHRAGILERAAQAIEEDFAGLLYLLAREAGRTLADGIAELRETVDFCRYYAARARADFSGPRLLDGPTGETNSWTLGGRGVFACIAPWNFPLAIFTGQVAAALAAGNAVVAKPAEQTPLIAARVTALLHQAGVPHTILRTLPGPGHRLGLQLVQDPRIAGVAFTGSTQTARLINRTLAERPGPIIPLIAETGGINAMIVDSSALPEQVVGDILASAFGSAGQRCSALRLLCVQDEIAPHLLDMLKDAAHLLVLGDPLDPATDIGPIIDAAARTRLETACAARSAPSWQLPLPPGLEHGTFFAPRLFELNSARDLRDEIFGPVLHVVRYQAHALEALLDDIDANGFGLTLGVHSRIEATQHRVVERLRVGNAYVNRNQIGAVVGVQPFGGRGLSGTGPKAGGPLTLYRFAEERVVAVNTAAAGGNATLLASGED